MVGSIDDTVEDLSRLTAQRKDLRKREVAHQARSLVHGAYGFLGFSTGFNILHNQANNGFDEYGVIGAGAVLTVIGAVGIIHSVRNILGWDRASGRRQELDDRIADYKEAVEKQTELNYASTKKD